MTSITHPLHMLRCHPDKNFKGREFEDLGVGYLAVTYDVDATSIYKPPGKDLGVDALFRLSDGRLVAVQFKCYAPGHAVTMPDINNFITEADKHGADVLVLVTTGRVGGNALHKIRERDITVHEYDDLIKVDCWERTATPAPALKPHTLRDYQQAAFDKAMAHTGPRGQVILPCRTGKSVIEAEIAGQHDSAVITVPTMRLAQQMAGDARQQLPGRPMLLLYSGEDWKSDTSLSMPIPATTDQLAVKKFRATHPQHVIISTYHSAHLLAGMDPFDVMLCDEAHRLATNSTKDSKFKIVLDDAQIPTAKRLFFTATPRVAAASLKSRLAGAGLTAYSMDDESQFGPRVHEMTWQEALTTKPPRIVPLHLVAMLANEASLAASIEKDGLTDVLKPYLGDAASVRDVAAVIGMLDAHKRYGIKTLLTFHSNVSGARDARKMTEAVAAELKIPVTTMLATSHSTTNTAAEAEKMLATDDGTLRIVFSVNRFTEGVNTPDLDAVIYFNTKKSVVSIAQSLARPITPAPGKKRAHALLPVFADTPKNLEDAVDASAWSGVKDVARALFTFGMTAEQIDVSLRKPKVILGGGSNDDEFSISLDYDAGFGLEKAAENIEAAVLRMAPDALKREAEKECARLGYVFVEYVSATNVKVECSVGHASVKKMETLRQDTAKTVCFQCVEQEVRDKYANVGWTVVEYHSTKNHTVACSNGHLTKVEGVRPSLLVNKGVKSMGCAACLQAEAEAILEVQGWTLVKYESTQSVTGACPRGHTQDFLLENLRKSVRKTTSRVCRTCLGDDVRAAVEAIGWTLVEYRKAADFTMRCPNGHEKVSRYRSDSEVDAYLKKRGVPLDRVSGFCKECGNGWTQKAK